MRFHQNFAPHVPLHRVIENPPTFLPCESALLAVDIMFDDVQIFKINLDNAIVLRLDSIDDFACTKQCQAVRVALQSVQPATWRCHVFNDDWDRNARETDGGKVELTQILCAKLGKKGTDEGVGERIVMDQLERA